MISQLDLFTPAATPLVAKPTNPWSRRPRLRPYQVECVERIREQFAGGARSTLAVLATGTGKTVCFAEVARDWPEGRVLILAHRQELIYQAASKVCDALGVEPDIELADMRSGATSRNKVLVSSVQTQCSSIVCRDCGGSGCGECESGRVYRFTKFDPRNFGLVICDEAHHIVSPSWQRIINYYRRNPTCRILGVTATPDRSDEAALGRVFESVAYEYWLPDAIDDGWLVEPIQEFVRCDGLDLSRCRTTAGDINEGDLDRVMKEDRNLYAVVEPTLAIAGNRPTLVFAVSVEQAMKTCDIINAKRPGQAIAIHGGTPGDERRRLLADYARGRYQFFCNCGIATEGFDEPRIGVIAIARPTKSRSLYAQMVGRGTRPIEPPMEGTADERKAAIAFSAKPDVHVIDFVGNAGRHKLISTADILGGNYEDDVIEAAVAKAKVEGKANMREALREAADELARRKREEDERRMNLRRSIDAKATFSRERIDPFDAFDLRAPREAAWHKGRKPSERQLELLAKSGLAPKELESLSFVQASQLIGETIRRRNLGLCSLKQARVLKKFGVDAKDVGFKRASEMIDAIAANGWKKPEGGFE